ncbi:MAG: pilus assembly protein PilM [Chloroflexota bacterium]|nr:pilus assembly protein PilM [Chloroflexota bacterium]
MKIPWLAREQLALHVESTELRGVVFKGRQVLRWSTQPLPPQVLQQNLIAEPHAFHAALDQLLTTLKISSAKTRLSLRHGRAIQRVLELPPVPDKLLAETVERQARREFPLPLEEIYLTWQLLPAPDNHRKIFAVGLPRQSVDSYLAALQRTQLKVTSLDLNTLALARAVNHPQVVIVELESTSTQILLIQDFIPQIVRTITLLDAAQFSSQEQAEQLIREIQRMLNFQQSTRTVAQPHWIPQICLTGTLSPENDLLAPLAATWSLAKPQPPLTLPPELPVWRYLPNLGLILKET